MPEQMPEQLRAEYESLKRRNDKGTRRLEWTVTIAFCEQHAAITETIPLGRHAGWPTSIDAEALAMRVLRLSDSSRSFIQWRGTKFFLKALKSFQKDGEMYWRSEGQQELRSGKERMIPG